MRTEELGHYKGEGGGFDVNININDIIFFVGLALMTTGLWLFSPAVSVTATGGILMLISYPRDAGGDS